MVTELFQYLAAGGEYINDVILIGTADETVRNCTVAAAAALNAHHPNLHIHIVSLEYTDITTDAELLDFTQVCRKTIVEERDRFDVDRVSLCVAGGRKNTCISLAMLAQYLDVQGVFHVIAHDIQVMNMALEQVRRELEALGAAEDPVALYREYGGVLDPVFFPSLESYDVIRVPYLPYPSGYLERIRAVLTSDRPVLREEVDLEESELRELERFKLVACAHKRLTPTHTGRFAAKAFLE